MLDTVEITLKAGQFACDYELPCNIPLRDLYPRLLKVLKNEHSGIFVSWGGILFEIEGTRLSNTQLTLSDYGVQRGQCVDLLRI